MSPNNDVTRWCHNCGVEIAWAPVRAWGRYYCCTVCTRGGACECANPLEDEEEKVTDERRTDVERVW